MISDTMYFTSQYMQELVQIMIYESLFVRRIYKTDTSTCGLMYVFELLKSACFQTCLALIHLKTLVSL